MKEKDKDCQKYESLFIFGDEKELMEHIAICPVCQKEHEKMMRVSSLVKETKPYFGAIKRRNFALKTICASFLLVFAFWGVGMYSGYQDSELLSALYYDAPYESVICDMGLPVDEYGLLLAD